MNEIEVFVSSIGNVSEIDRLKYLISDEKFNLINFADDYLDSQVEEFKNNVSFAILTSGEIDLSLLNQQELIIWSTLSGFDTYHVEVDSVAYNEVTLNLTTPVQVTFNPQDLTAYKKIYKIEYIFDYETGESKTQTFFYKPTSSSTLNLPYSAEPGDPRNFKQTFVYNLTGEFSKTVYALVKFYEFGNKDPNEILYTINLNTPEVDGVNGYFNEIHLVANKMFGFDDKLLYTFETYTPQYLLPILVNWSNKESDIAESEPNKLKRLNLKPYKLLEPFENQNIQNKHITGINFVPSNSYYIDEGLCHRYNIITIDTHYYIKTMDGKYLRIGDYYNSNLNKPQPPIKEDLLLISEDDDPILQEDGDFIIV